MIALAYVVIALAVGLCLYACVLYPVLLKALAVFRPRAPKPGTATGARPLISIVVPAHNEAAVIAATLERILALDYPADRRQILVVSDASTDGTDEIVTRFAARGVELLRLPERRGKTAAENASRSHLRGEIIINTDASVRIDGAAARHLVAALDDPSVGVASGRDCSVSNVDDRSNPGEHAYVGYDMWVRDLETSVPGGGGGIVGASGCLYAIRRELHMHQMPEGLSRDFASALVAREHGYRAVSVPAAVCYVPRSLSPRREYRRKVRTMARGLRTLWYKRALLDPRRYGLFAWMLFSHKLCRWLMPWATMLGGAAIALVALTPPPGHGGGGRGGILVVALGGIALLAAAIGWLWPEGRPMPRLISLPTYALSGTIAALEAWVSALGRGGTALWEPTRRGGGPDVAPIQHL